MRVTGQRVRQALLGAAVLTVVALVVVFVRAYQDAAPPATAGAGPVTTGARSGAAPGPTSAPSPAVDPRGRAAAAVLSGSEFGPGPITVTPAQPPGFVIAPVPKYTLVLTARSATRLPRLGYIAPTSPDHPYGDVKDPGGTHWSLTTTVTGKPYYAALFVQSGASGEPITCTITIDGVVKSHKSTSGAYGRQVCVA